MQRELCSRHEVKLLLLSLQIPSDKRGNMIAFKLTLLQSSSFLFLKWLQAMADFSLKSITRWSEQSTGNPMFLSVQIPREPRFSSVLWNAQSLLPALLSQADQLPVLISIILDFQKYFCHKYVQWFSQRRLFFFSQCRSDGNEDTCVGIKTSKKPEQQTTKNVI